VSIVLTKDLLRVSRAGGGYHPQFAERSDRPLAAKTIGVFQRHVGDSRAALDEALDALEADADDFKLARGFASLVDREAVFETQAPLPPVRARRAAFEAAMDCGGVTTPEERGEALDRAANALGVTPDAVDTSLTADRAVEQVLAEFDPRWAPDELLLQYNLSLAQTCLFDATEVRVRSSDPKALVSAVKRLRLMYEIRKTDSGREVVVTGPDALFQRTRRYGTAFARLLRSIATAGEWRLTARIDDRGREREMHLTSDDVSVPGVEPMAEPGFDSDVEADFAARFRGLDLDWTLVREPEPLETGTSVMIPDFAFDYKYGEFRVFFEIMGFWTPDYVAKKLGQLADVEDVELVVAVDESLGVGEEIAARDHRVVPYSGSVRVKDVVDVLRDYETDLVADAASSLPTELVPDDDVVSLTDLAATHGVAVDVLSDVSFPAHELVGRTLIRPHVLESLAASVEPGMSLSPSRRRSNRGCRSPKLKTSYTSGDSTTRVQCSPNLVTGSNGRG
jgi:predicted nuclease of restriction endonuclease-like RecB superfamily